jgi:hypothetical protein
VNDFRKGLPKLLGAILCTCAFIAGCGGHQGAVPAVEQAGMRGSEQALNDQAVNPAAAPLPHALKPQGPAPPSLSSRTLKAKTFVLAA